MKKKMLASQRKTLVLAIAIPLFFLGVLLAFYTTLNASRARLAEHDEHLKALVSSVDHNISSLLDRYQVELTATIQSGAVSDAEELLLETEDGTQMQRVLPGSILLETDLAERILISDGTHILLSSDREDALEYTIYEDTDNDALCVVRDKSRGCDYLALSVPSETSELSYLALLDIETFYRSAVVDDIYENYWIALYDAGCGLVIHNDGEQPIYAFYSAEELAQREDGFTLMQEIHQAGSSAIANYQFLHDGETEEARIAVLPVSVSENSCLTIGISCYEEEMAALTRMYFFHSLCSAVLISFSAAAAVFFLLHSGKREKELANELKALEEENSLAAKLLQQQQDLAHHQKLETIGTLTAGIAHEFNNLLSPIMSNSLLILENSLAEDGETYDNALEIYSASQKAKNLISKISGLSRRSPTTQMQPISAARLVNSVLSMLDPAVPNNITVKKRIHTAAMIMGVEAELGHMLLNLLINAVQAIEPNDGTVTLEVREENELVVFSISDTGKGIPETLLPSIFDPFFTTKETGRGTGLGLPIAQRTANNHGGTIQAENLPQGGAKFTVAFHSFRQ